LSHLASKPLGIIALSSMLHVGHSLPLLDELDELEELEELVETQNAVLILNWLPYLQPILLIGPLGELETKQLGLPLELHAGISPFTPCTWPFTQIGHWTCVPPLEELELVDGDSQPVDLK